MNTKVVAGVVVVLVIIAGGYALLRPSPAPATIPTAVATSTASASTTSQTPVQTPTGTSTGPIYTFGTPVEVLDPAFAKFDTSSFISTSTHPVVTGTANVAKVGILITDSTGTGLVATPNVTVTNTGTWTYYSPVSLKPGTYTLTLSGGLAVATATLSVQ